MLQFLLYKFLYKDNFKIDKEIRGIESNGMICSASELDLWDDPDGILLLDNTIKPGSILVQFIILMTLFGKWYNPKSW